MEATETSLKEYLSVIRRRKVLLLATFLTLLVLSTLAAFLWPPTYRSTATILIREQEIPRDLVPSTITSFADQRLLEIQARVVTSANLIKLIEDFDLYPDLRRRLPATEIVDEMRDDYSLDLVSADVIDPRTGRPTQATILFTVSFDYQAAAVAQQVTNRLVDLYLAENLRDRTERAQETTSFLSEQAAKMAREVSQLEERLARFKQENGNALPELQSLNVQMMDRTESELREIQRQIQNNNQQLIYLRAELATASRDAPIYTRDGAVLAPEQQLAALQSQYTTLNATYGPSHPDVLSVKRQIEALEGSDNGSGIAALNERLAVVESELAELQGRYSADHPDVKRVMRQRDQLLAERDVAQAASESQPAPRTGASNPAYVRLAAQLSAAEANAQSLLTRQAQLAQKLESYEQRLVAAPQVEREYALITRDMQNARMKYQEIRTKQLAAEVSESLEQGRKGERFEVVEPALLPTLPHTPNRLALLFLGLVISAAGSVGTTAISESMDSAIHSPQRLGSLIGVGPIATIPMIVNEIDERRKRRFWWSLTGAFAAGAVLFLTLVHFLYRPLDVLWFIILRKLGI